MHGKTGDFSEYTDTLPGVDYTHPAYYRPTSEPQTPAHTEPASAEYAPFAARGESMDAALMSEYRGPADLQDYAAMLTEVLKRRRINPALKVRARRKVGRSARAWPAWAALAR